MPEQGLYEHFRQVRAQSLAACEPLAIEDYGLQAEAFTSPPKWHLAHTSWFFETFLLMPFLPGYETPNAQYAVLFNSYYNGVGQQFSRPQRGLLSRPTVNEVRAYRSHVDDAMARLLEDTAHPQRAEILQRSRLGIEHEQQHQELFYTDLKYSLFANPLYPAYRALPSLPLTAPSDTQAFRWLEYAGGLVEVGAQAEATADARFAFDNEGPAHRVYLNPYALANRLVTNAEYQAFIDDGGYRRPEFWLADGWAVVQEQGWRRPLYWLEEGSAPVHFTLYGVQPRVPHEPVTHLSGYEADAYATWAGARLPTEFEWEAAARAQPCPETVFDPSRLHPSAASGADPLQQLFADCWQWTGSAYRPYPGFKAGTGAIGEYNGKFMANQWVLRGGSCVSQRGHVRATYRNFFYPQDRWQFSGLRLARDL